MKGRRKISCPQSPTQRLSCITETLLKPVVPYIKDNWVFVKFSPTYLIFDNDMYYFKIESLYTLIPTELGLEAIEYWIMRKRYLIPQRLTKDLLSNQLNLF